MDALLLEKAEIQQSFALSRKDLEKNKKQAKVKCIQLGCDNIYFFHCFLKLYISSTDACL